MAKYYVNISGRRHQTSTTYAYSGSAVASWFAVQRFSVVYEISFFLPAGKMTSEFVFNVHFQYYGAKWITPVYASEKDFMNMTLI